MNHEFNRTRLVRNDVPAFGIIPAILGFLPTVVPALARFGVGEKSRMKEMELSIEAENQKSDNLTKLAVIGGVFLVLGFVLFFVLRK